MHPAARGLSSLLGVVALTLPVVDGAAAARSTVTTKKPTGQAFQADRWGTVR